MENIFTDSYDFDCYWQRLADRKGQRKTAQKTEDKTNSVFKRGSEVEGGGGCGGVGVGGYVNEFS